MSLVYSNILVLICCYFITVLVSLVCASNNKDNNHQPSKSIIVGGSSSVNKPIIGVMRSPKPWHFSNDYVRCFCNLPSCVTTGYMCKSSAGGCFSDVLDQTTTKTNVYKARHGCLELISEKEQRARCPTRGGMNERTIIRRKENSKSLFLCCHHDMCNHIDSPQTKSLIDNSLLGGISNNDDDDSRIQQQPPSEPRDQEQEEYLYSNSDVWFRAATIAVPICGAVILFVLIALAIKILKSEHENNTAMHKLGPTMHIHHMPRQCKMAPPAALPSQHQQSNSKDVFDPYDRLEDYLPIMQPQNQHHQQHNNINSNQHQNNNVFFANQCLDDVVQHHQRQMALQLQQQKVPLLLANEFGSLGGNGVLVCGGGGGIEKNATNAMLNLRNNESILLEIEKKSNPTSTNDLNCVSSINNATNTKKCFLS